MEIGQKGICCKKVGGIDEEVGISGKRLFGGDRRLAGGAEEVLHCAEGSGTDGETEAFFGRLKTGEGIGRDFIEFLVHLVLLDGLSLDGFEGTEADVEAQVPEGMAGGEHALKDAGSEVEASGGGSGGMGARRIGVDGLVALLIKGLPGIIGIPLNVGGKGHFPGRGSHVGDGGKAIKGEADEAGAILLLFENLGGEGALPSEGASGRKAFPWTKKAPPLVVGRFGPGTKEEAFHGTTSGAVPGEAGLEDGDGVAETDGGTGKEVGEFVKEVVGNLSSGAVDEEETRFVALVGGDLGDGLPGQMVIKLRSFHSGVRKWGSWTGLQDFPESAGGVVFCFEVMRQGGGIEL